MQYLCLSIFNLSFVLVTSTEQKYRKKKLKTCLFLSNLYSEFYQDTNEGYGAGTYTLRCELADGKWYYLCAEDHKVFLVVSVFVKS